MKSSVQKDIAGICTCLLVAGSLLFGCDNEMPGDNGTTTTTTAIVMESSCDCDSFAATSNTTVTVNSVSELRSAVESANSGGNLTIQLADGTYELDQMLWISGDGVTFQSVSGNRDAVVIRGQGMTGGVSHVFNVAGDDFRVADMTIGWVANHAIQIHGNEDADSPLIHNVRIVDTGEQMIKISFSENVQSSSDNGIIECCSFEYSQGIGPQYYIGGIDGHSCKNYIVRNNTFSGIRSPENDLAEHAVHFWSNSENTLVENNVITRCDRGIGFGLGDRGHVGGMIRNNMVHTNRDVGIGLENAANTSVYNNTLYTENYANSIECRFAGSSGITIINNLTSQAITERDGGSARLDSNYTQATEKLFVDAASGDLHLAGNTDGIVDSGSMLTDVSVDIDCESRPGGAAYDIGADEL